MIQGDETLEDTCKAIGRLNQTNRNLVLILRTEEESKGQSKRRPSGWKHGLHTAREPGEDNPNTLQGQKNGEFAPDNRKIGVQKEGRGGAAKQERKIA